MTFLRQRLSNIFFSSTSKDAFIALIGNALIAIAGVLFSVILARYLDGPKEFGVVSALLAISMILGSLGDVGITSTLINFLPKQPNNRQLILSLAFWAQVVIGLLMITAMSILIPFSPKLVPGSTPVHFLLLGFLGFAICVQVFSVAVFKAEKKFLWSSVIMALDSWIKLFLIGILLWSNNLQITTVLLASLAASSIAATLGLSFEFKKIRFIFPRQQAKEIFQFTKWITLMQLFSVFIARLDVILLNALSSSFNAGIFAAASRVSLVFVLLVSSIGSVVSPRFSGFNQKAVIVSYLKKVILLTCAIAVIMVIFAAAAPTIIIFVFGPEYRPAIGVFRALSFAMIPFLFTIVTVNPIIYTFNKPDFIAKVTIIQVLLIVILNLILIPKLDAYAPTIALTVANLFVLTLTGWKLHRLLK